MRLTGRIGRVFQKHLGIADSAQIMDFSPYAIIDMAAAVEADDEVAQFQICYHVQKIMGLSGDEKFELYSGFERPGKIINDYTRNMEWIDGDVVRSTYRRRWDLYQNEELALEIIEHRHDGYGAVGTEWFVTLYSSSA